MTISDLPIVLPTFSRDFKHQQFLIKGNSGELVCKTNEAVPVITEYVWTKEGQKIAPGDASSCKYLSEGNVIPLGLFIFMIALVLICSVITGSISESRPSKYNVTGNTLQISSIESSDSGIYWCQARNPVGLSEPSPFITATLIDPPIFIKKSPYFLS